MQVVSPEYEKNVLVLFFYQGQLNRLSPFYQCFSILLIFLVIKQMTKFSLIKRHLSFSSHIAAVKLSAYFIVNKLLRAKICVASYFLSVLVITSNLNFRRMGKFILKSSRLFLFPFTLARNESNLCPIDQPVRQVEYTNEWTSKPEISKLSSCTDFECPTFK